MADFNQFGSAKPLQEGDPQHCAHCEAMLADAIDGTLSPTDQAAFDLHMVGCESCSTMLADAKRGSAWMEMLKSSQPEPSSALLERILAQTSGQNRAETTSPIVLGPTDRLRHPNTLLGQPTLFPAAGQAMPPAAFGSTKVLPFRSRIASAFNLRAIGHTLLQPRLAMTAAMAFFSIALTMNLTGIRLSDIHASDLKPSSILRSCYQAKARVVRYSDNLRVVYELESRVRDLQRASDGDSSTSTPASQSSPNARPDQKPSGDQQPDDQNPGKQNPSPRPEQKQARPRPKSGTSRRETPGSSLRFVGSYPHRGNPSITEAFVTFSPSLFKNVQQGGTA